MFLGNLKYLNIIVLISFLLKQCPFYTTAQYNLFLQNTFLSYDSSEHSIIFVIETITKVLRDTTRLAEQQRRVGYKKMPNMSL